jgi:ethanolamine utilization cobalamin adenosyltransferase
MTEAPHIRMSNAAWLALTLWRSLVREAESLAAAQLIKADFTETR